MWQPHLPKYFSIVAGTLLVIITYSFMVEEYFDWKASVACDSICQLLGCKSGKLLDSQQGSTVACQCDSEQYYLVIVH